MPLERHLEQNIEVIDLGIDETTDLKGEINLSGIINRKLMQTGTHNIAEGAAMDYDTAVKAVERGIEIADIFAERDITFCHRRME